MFHHPVSQSIPAFLEEPAAPVDLSKRVLARKLVSVGNCDAHPNPAGKAPAAAAMTPAERNALDLLLTLINRRLELAPRMAQARWNGNLPGATPEQEQQQLALLRRLMPEADSAERQFVTRFFQSQFDANRIVQRALHEKWQSHDFAFRDPHDLRALQRQADSFTLKLLPAVRAVRPLLTRSSARRYLNLRELELTSPAVSHEVRHHLLRVLFNPGLMPTTVQSHKD